MEYETLDDIKHDFIGGNFDFPESFTVSGIPYKIRSSSQYSIEDMIKRNYKAVVVYSTSPALLKQLGDNINEVGLNHWILFLWGFTPKNRMVPYDVRSMNVARGNIPIKEDQVGNGNDNFIGSTVEIKITNIPGSSPMKGKVDTGADICSLHADGWKVMNDSVQFSCPELSNNVITASLVDTQSVRTSDGRTEYRPVIELNVKINGKLLNNVLFNLNDRGKMEFPILVGRNALSSGNFKIDPSMDEGLDVDINWDLIHETTKSTSVAEDEYLIDDIINTIQTKYKR